MGYRCPKMEPEPMSFPLNRLSLALLVALLLSSCAPLTTTMEQPAPATNTPEPQFEIVPPQHTPGVSLPAATPDAPHYVPPLRAWELSYTIQAGDTLRQIAARNNVTVQSLVEANQLDNPDVISPGQQLVIPPPTPAAPAPANKLIPDSELVYGPYADEFNIREFIELQNGALAAYHEDVGGQQLSGAQIVLRVSRNQSVNPRLLLAVLEYQSGWLTQKQPTTAEPLGQVITAPGSLYHLLNWAANNLNRGYYLWRVDALAGFTTVDGAVAPASAEINAGTVALQYLFSLLYEENEWRQVISPSGWQQTYQTLFGDPFEWTYEPLLPPDLRQPAMQLPFERGVSWSFTGGPHGAWDDGSAWAAIDFAPPMELLGCYPNDSWVTAVADGLVTRSADGVVVLDLDGDGNEGSGWILFYLHIASEGRVAAGTYLKAGERIGHPSCEGGVSTGTHLHMARRYNGEWIPADGDLPFVLDGWVSGGHGYIYEGTMTKGNQVVESCECQKPVNAIQR